EHPVAIAHAEQALRVREHEDDVAYRITHIVRQLRGLRRFLQRRAHTPCSVPPAAPDASEASEARSASCAARSPTSESSRLKTSRKQSRCVMYMSNHFSS